MRNLEYVSVPRNQFEIHRRPQAARHLSRKFLGFSTQVSGFACRLKRSMQHFFSRLIPRCFSTSTGYVARCRFNLNSAVFFLDSYFASGLGL
jgi:hypothetical protein